MQCQSSILPVQLFKMNVSNQSAAVSFKVLLSRFDLPIYTAIPLSEQAFRISNITIGFLLNIIILLVIVVSRQLHNPRHIFWVGVSLINQFYLMQCALEIVAIVYPNATICPLFVLNAECWILGIAPLLVSGCLRPLRCNRLLGVVQEENHEQSDCSCSHHSFVLTFIVITSPFRTGFKSISTCTINLTHMHFVLGWDFLLGLFSVILHVKIYIVSRLAIREYAPNLNQFPLTQRFNQENKPQGNAFFN